MRNKKNTRALGLLSGGLDSILAVKVLQEQNIHVTGLSFVTPFFGPDLAKKAAEDLGIELIVRDITEVHFQMLKNPPHGYGKTMNPCIDCHALMLKTAGTIMEAEGYDLIFTGEVLDERPMSQNRASLETVGRCSGYKDHILRPLSAKFLEMTIPEKKGLVDRERLLDIRGRSRKKQIELAAKFGLVEYPNPAGGCLLTDRNYSKRLKELLEHEEDPDIRDVSLLSVGRHYRLGEKIKLVVGRNEKENLRIEDLCKAEDTILRVPEVPGPTCLLTGALSLSPDDDILRAAAVICASYGDTEDNDKVRVSVRTKSAQYEIEVRAEKKQRTVNRIN